jgi:hypothetical protein
MNDNNYLNNLYDDRFFKKINMFVGEDENVIENNYISFDDKRLEKYSKNSKCFIAFNDGIFNLTEIKNEINDKFRDYIENINPISLINSSGDSVGPYKIFNFFKNSVEIEKKFYDVGFNLDCGIYYPNKKIKQNIKFCINNKIRFLYSILRNLDNYIEDIYINDSRVNYNNNVEIITEYIDELRKYANNNEYINIRIMTDNNYVGIYFSMYNTLIYFLFLIFVFLIFLIYFIVTKNKKILYALVLLSLILIYFYYKKVYKFKKSNYKYRLESIYNKRKPNYLIN